MAKSVNDAVLDAALDIIRNNCTKMVVCSQQPTTYTEANATYALAEVAMAAGDYTIANGDTSGRKATTTAKSNITVNVTGTGTHVALLDVTLSRLIYVTTCPAQAMTAAGKISIASWKIEILDPT